MDIHHPKTIIEGFRDDFDHIVEDFPRTSPTLELKDFFQYWSNNHLDCIFANRFDPRELYEAITEMNQVLVQIVTDSHTQTDNSRVIGLYFLLCLYVKQPTRLRRKIRLTCQDSILIQHFSDKLPDLKGLNFVWKQLRAQQAIVFVEERVIYGPSLLVTKGARKLSNLNSSNHSTSYSKERTVEFLTSRIEPVIGDLECTNASYERIKDALKLDDYQDPTVEIQTNGTVQEFLEHAKALIHGFKKS